MQESFLPNCSSGRQYYWDYQSTSTKWYLGRPPVSDFWLERPPTILCYTGTPYISLHAIVGHSNPKTLGIKDKIQNHWDAILFDGGSTHNSIQDHVVIFPGLQVSRPNNMPKMVVTGLDWNATVYS